MPVDERPSRMATVRVAATTRFRVVELGRLEVRAQYLASLARMQPTVQPRVTP